MTDSSIPVVDFRDWVEGAEALTRRAYRAARERFHQPAEVKACYHRPRLAELGLA